MAERAGDSEAIEQALHDLKNAWEAAGAGWADDARIEIERDFLEPIRGRAREAGKTLQALALLVHDAQRDCA